MIDAPKHIFVRKSRSDFLGTKMKLIRIRGGCAYYAKLDGGCSSVEYISLGVDNFEQLRDKYLSLSCKIYFSLDDLHEAVEKSLKDDLIAIENYRKHKQYYGDFSNES